MISNSLEDITRTVRFLIKDISQKDGRNVFIFNSDTSFTLSEVFVNASTIKVYKNNTLFSQDDWEYNEDTNKVVIDPIDSGEALIKDDTIIITFEYYKRFSDTEIEGYIESSLSYFSQHKYKKTFEIVNGDILAINNTNPTVSELQFIALIASIMIDPQNVAVDTPEFKIAANRDESDQKQISKAFAHFKRFVGSVDYFYVVPKEIYNGIF